VRVAAVVKVTRAEAIAAATPQQRKALLAELCEQRRKVRDDQRSDAYGRPSVERLGRAGVCSPPARTRLSRFARPWPPPPPPTRPRNEGGVK
jgi:hypothetical protein